MTRKDIKSEIEKIINDVPDDTLEDIYKILKEYANKEVDSTKLNQNLNKILKDFRQ